MVNEILLLVAEQAIEQNGKNKPNLFQLFVKKIKKHISTILIINTFTGQMFVY